MASAATIGFGVSSASTVATMFIVEVEPEARWDRLIDLLQAELSGGQLVGLLLAGVLGLRHVADALVLAALLLLLAIPLAYLYAPDPLQVVSRPSLPPRTPRSGDIGAQRQLHRPTAAAFATLAGNDLTRFLAAWLVSYTATNGLSVMMSVVMVRLYGAHATLETGAYALGVGLSLLIYRRVAGWDKRYGPWRVLMTGLAMRAVLIAMMLGLALAGRNAGASVILPILLCFAGTQLVWPLLRRQHGAGGDTFPGAPGRERRSPERVDVAWRHTRRHGGRRAAAWRLRAALRGYAGRGDARAGSRAPWPCLRSQHAGCRGKGLIVALSAGGDRHPQLSAATTGQAFAAH